jgi:hypothetical protein
MTRRAAAAVVFGVLGLAIASRASAQPAVGLVGGTALSTLANFGDQVSVTDGRLAGVLAGVYVDLPLAHRVSLQPEVAYLRKGVHLEGPVAPGSTAPVRITEWFDYLEVPVLVRLGAVGRRDGLYAVAGPAVARLVRAREGFDVPGVAVLDEDIADGVTATDVALVAGAGLAISRVAIEARFERGLRNLIPPGERDRVDRTPTTRSLALVGPERAGGYLVLRRSRRMPSSASMISSREARLLLKLSFRLKALVGGRNANT